MLQVIDQKQFNSPDFCKEVTTCVKEYASRNGLDPKVIFAARRNDDYTFHWEINVDNLLQNTALINFLKESLEEKYPEQISLLINELDYSFSNLLNNISRLAEGISFDTTIIADCTEVYSSEQSEVVSGTLTDYNKSKAVIRFYTKKNECENEGFENYEELSDKKLLIQGKISYYKEKNCYQITASKIKNIGLCTRLEKLARWENECSDILRSMEDVRKEPVPSKRLTKIGLIASQSTKGYHDFNKTINQLFRDYNKPAIIFRDIIMNPQNLLEALNSFQEIEDELDYIAIVRGGGDKESLAELCEPNILRAIHDLGNVVTGIGHSNDNLLCARAALFDAGTPTEAAHFMSKMFWTVANQQKNKKTAKDNLKTEFDELKIKYQEQGKVLEELQNDYAKLKKEYEELKKKHAVLQSEEQKPKGFFSSIMSQFKN